MPNSSSISFRSIVGLLISCFGLVQLGAVLYFIHSLQIDPAALHASAGMHRPQIVLFGDSLTQHSFDEGGWGARLASHYQRKADIVLRGYSGYNLAWAQHLVHKVFPPDAAVKPALVTVFFGANDAALAGGVSKRQHVPLERYTQLLQSTVQHLRAVGAAEVLIITPPPIDEPARIAFRKQKWGINEFSEQPERLNEVTGQYAEACREVAASERLPVLDLWTGFQRNPEWRTYLSDGLHLTPRGNAALWNLLSDIIDKQLPNLRYDSLPFDYPLHDDISADPALAFANH